MTTEPANAQPAATGKPSTLALRPDSLPPSLKALPVWLCWRWLRKNDKWTKPTVSAHTLRKADVTDPESLATFEKALARVTAGEVDGVGIALEPAGLLGVDIDKCRDPDTGRLTDDASAIIAALGSYAEVSPSGTGVKVLVVADKPGPRCRTGPIEIYAKARYFTLTGHMLPGSAPEPQPRQEAVDVLYANLFPAKGQSTALAVVPSAPPDPAGLSDEQLLAVGRIAAWTRR